MNITRLLALTLIGIASGIASYALLKPSAVQATAAGQQTNLSSQPAWQTDPAASTWQELEAPTRRSRDHHSWQEDEQWEEREGSGFTGEWD